MAHLVDIVLEALDHGAAGLALELVVLRLLHERLHLVGVGVGVGVRVRVRVRVKVRVRVRLLG